ncbi:hypothetical protein TNCV_3627771 [Trichonephila clavipes]|nr:hypothetical protein TNCV_3627771 [Trichonephila clavipes]
MRFTNEGGKIRRMREIEQNAGGGEKKEIEEIPLIPLRPPVAAACRDTLQIQALCIVGRYNLKAVFDKRIDNSVQYLDVGLYLWTVGKKVRRLGIMLVAPPKTIPEYSSLVFITL